MSRRHRVGPDVGRRRLAADLVARAGGTPVRLATTSLRVPALVARGEVTDLELWNAGGSGSLETSAADPVVRGGRVVEVVPTYRGTGNAW